MLYGWSRFPGPSLVDDIDMDIFTAAVDDIHTDVFTAAVDVVHNSVFTTDDAGAFEDAAPAAHIGHGSPSPHDGKGPEHNLNDS